MLFRKKTAKKKTEKPEAEKTGTAIDTATANVKKKVSKPKTAKLQAELDKNFAYEFNRDFVTDLESMSDSQYRKMKEAEKAEVEDWLKTIDEMEDPEIVNRDRRVVYDLKMMFEDSVRLYGNNVLYKQIMKGDTEYSRITFNQAMKHIQGIGTKLIDIGLKDAHIGVIGPNCYEWAESYNAIIGGVGIVAPLDKELNEEDLENLCKEGDLKAIITCSEKHYKRAKSVWNAGNTDLEYIISTTLDEHEDKKAGILSWEQLRAEGIKLVDKGDRRWIDARIKNDDMAVIIFTSGTTGVAKGVMLSHKNICANLVWANTYLDINEHDTMFSVLPMHHTYESTCTMTQTMYKGASVAYNRGLKYITKDMQLAQPTVMLSVPLIYEKFYNSINKALTKQGKDKSLKRLLAIDRLTSRIGIHLSRKACNQITAQFGGRIRMFIAGGAKINPEVLAFFRSLGILTVQGYGLTETAPLLTLNPVSRRFIRDDSAGRLIPGIEIKVVDADENGNGELCFRGPEVMLGYYNNPTATDDCMEDGWFHTGDLGYIDEDKYVYITGRKKNVIIAGNGKNVFPEELEEKLLRSKFIEECMVWADESGEETGHRGIYATIRVDREAAAAELGDRAADAAAIYKLIDREVDSVNENLPDWKMVKHIRIREREFDKTTGLKIRRFIEDNKLGD